MHSKGRVSTEMDGSFQLSHLAFLQAGRESSSASDVREFFTVEIIPKAVFLVSPCISTARQLVDTAALASLSDSPNSNPKFATSHGPLISKGLSAALDIITFFPLQTCIKLRALEIVYLLIVESLIAGL